MICTKLAKKVLTKKEQRHLTEANIRGMEVFRRSRATQKEWEKTSKLETCSECRHIAVKLGIEEP